MDIHQQVVERVQQATQAQKPALETDACVWVSANAGTGKTHVLTGRILKLLVCDESLKPSEILAITFTDTGAKQMEASIKKRLSAWVRASDNALDADLEDLLGRPPFVAERLRARQLFSLVLDAAGGLSVSTIHGFCQKMLSAFPLEAGVPVGFQVLDDSDVSDLMRQAQDVVFRAEHSDDVAWMLPYLAGVWGEKNLREELAKLVGAERRRLLHVLRHCGGFDGFKSALAKALNVPEGMDWAQAEAWMVGVMLPPESAKPEIINAARLLQAHGKVKAQAKGQKILDFLNAEAGQVARFWDAYIGVMTKKKGTEPQSEFSDKDVKAAVGEGTDAPLFVEVERVWAAQVQLQEARTYLTSVALVGLANRVFEAYEELKRNRAMLDFDDIIIYARRLLQDQEQKDWVNYKLDRRVRHVFLDEAQDTNTDQWQIVASVIAEFFNGSGVHEETRGHPRTFLAVGDMKQAIYRFQGGESRIFAQMQSFLKQQEQDVGARFERADMQVSFRTSPAVLQATDMIFSQPAMRQLVDVTAEEIAHPSRHIDKEGLVEVWPLIQNEAQRGDRNAPAHWQMPFDPEEKDDGADAFDQLAVRIAETIAGMLQDARPLSCTGKPVQPGDIMILLRSRNQALLTPLLQELNIKGVPHTGADKIQLQDNPAVADLVALGWFLLDYSDDLRLAHVLRSPLFGLTDSHLFALSQQSKGRGGLWPALCQQVDAPFVAAKDCLKVLLKQVDFDSAYDVYVHALALTDGRGKFLQAQGDGVSDAAVQVVNEPIDFFLDAVQEFEQYESRGLLAFLNSLALSGVERKKNMAQAGNAVRIITSHSAKGLEAPVVFLPDTTAQIRVKGSHCWLQDDLGADVLYAYGSKEDVPLIKRMRDQEFVHVLEDEARLLYVAMTRAKERLYIGAATGSKFKFAEGAQEAIMAADWPSWYALVRQSIAVNPEKWDVLDDCWRHHTPAPQGVAVAHVEADVMVQDDDVTLPQWLAQSGAVRPVEEEIKASALLRKVDQPQASVDLFSMGQMVHRLLEILPNLEDSQRKSHAIAWLAQQKISEAQQQKVLAQALAVMADFSWVFGGESRAEVPLTAVIDGKRLKEARIDRLVRHGGAMWIVDFKTNGQVPEEVPVPYQRQLQLYAAALKQILPDETIKAAIIWTAAEKPELVEVDVSA